MTIRINEHWRLPALLAAAAFVFVVVAHTLMSDTDLGSRRSAALALAQALAVVLQSRLPIVGWAASLAAVVYASVAVDETLWVDAMFNSYLVVLAITALRVTWRSTVIVWTASTVTTVVVALAMPRGGLAEVVESMVLTALVLVAAAAVRALFDARRDAVASAMESNRQRQRNAVLEERTRIARELHDVVAHHMSVVTIQAEAAQYRVTDLSPDLKAGLDAIRTSAAAALVDMRRILGLLRADADPPAHPQPGVGDLGELVDGIRAAGTAVVMTHQGTPRKLPTGVGVCAYRIVQEALSNAVRHANGSAIAIELSYRQRDLAVSVTNGAGGSTSRTHGNGHGLVGMRERVAMLDGEFAAGPTEDGGYRVRAVLPVDQRTTR